jgi:hypothetical protein
LRIVQKQHGVVEQFLARLRARHSEESAVMMVDVDEGERDKVLRWLVIG